MAGKSDIRAGGAFVELFTRDGLTKGLRAAEAKLRAFGQGVSAVGQRMFNMGIMLGTPLLLAGKVFADMGSDMLDMSQRTGIAVESLSALRYAAEQSGASVEELESAFKFMQKGNFGQSADDFLRIADEIAGLGSEAQKTQRILEVFGKAGTRLKPLFNDGAQGIRALMAEAERLGLVMSTEDAQAAEAFGDALSSLSAVLKRVVFNVGGALSPVLHDVATLFTDAAAAVGKWVKGNESLVRLAGAAVVAFTGLGLSLMVLGPAIRAIAFGIGALSVAFGVLKVAAVAAWAVITSPILLITAGIVGIGAAIVHASGQGASMLGALGSAFQSVGATASQTWQGISDAISSGNWGLAFQIALAGLRVAWSGFIGEMRGAWVRFTGFFEDTWAAVINSVAQGLLTFVRRSNELIAQLFSGMTTVASAIGLDIGNPIAAGAAGIGAVQETMTADAAREQRERERRRNQALAPDPAAAAELARLQAELTALTDRARNEALWTEALRPGGPGARPAPPSLPEIGRSIESKGTFSAFALGGLGASALTKTENLLTEIRNAVRNNAQPAFT